MLGVDPNVWAEKVVTVIVEPGAAPEQEVEAETRPDVKGRRAVTPDVVRGLGVTFGPAFLLDLVALGSLATPLRQVVGPRAPCRAERVLRPVAGLGAAAVVTYLLVIQPRLRRWGASDDEAHPANGLRVARFEPDPEQFAFVFNGWLQRRIRTFSEPCSVLRDCPPEPFEAHLARGDFSHWIGDVYGDYPLVARLREIEARHRRDELLDARGHVLELVEQRYVQSDDANPSQRQSSPTPHTYRQHTHRSDDFAVTRRTPMATARST
jgi:hypothetical protein